MRGRHGTGRCGQRLWHWNKANATLRNTASQTATTSSPRTNEIDLIVLGVTLVVGQRMTSMNDTDETMHSRSSSRRLDSVSTHIRRTRQERPATRCGTAPKIGHA